MGTLWRKVSEVVVIVVSLVSVLLNKEGPPLVTLTSFLVIVYIISGLFGYTRYAQTIFTFVSIGEIWGIHALIKGSCYWIYPDIFCVIILHSLGSA